MAEPKTIFDIEPDDELETLLDAEADAAFAAGRFPKALCGKS